MRRGILIIIALLPTAAMGQQMDFGLANRETGSVFSAQAAALLTRDDDSAFLVPGHATPIDAELTQTPNSPPPQNKKQAKSNHRGAEIKRPSTADSMAGYVDNAIVGTQIRFRSDAGFGVNVPDRSEFFYAKCGCYGFLPKGNLAYDPNAPGLGPGGSNNLNFQQVYLHLEYAPASRFSVFTEVPFRFLQPHSFLTTLLDIPILKNGQGFTASGMPGGSPLPNPSGISDVQAGFKFAMDISSGHSLTFQFRAYFPTGNVGLGLGTGHYSVEPSLLYFQKLTERMAIESQVGDWHPIGGSAGVPTSSPKGFAGDVAFYGVGPSYEVYRGELVRFAPVLEVYGWHVLGGFQTGPPKVDASGTNIVNLKVGARTSIGRSNSFYVGFGQAVTHSVWYKHIIRAEYRYSF